MWLLFTSLLFCQQSWVFHVRTTYIHLVDNGCIDTHIFLRIGWHSRGGLGFRQNGSSLKKKLLSYTKNFRVAATRVAALEEYEADLALHLCMYITAPNRWLLL